MNEEQFKAYLDRVQRGEQLSETERLQLSQYMDSNYGRVPIGDKPSTSAQDYLFGLTPDPLFNVEDPNRAFLPTETPISGDALSQFQAARVKGKAVDNSSFTGADSWSVPQKGDPGGTKTGTQSPPPPPPPPPPPNQMPFLTPGGSDLTTKANQFGSSLQNPAFKGAGVIAGLSLGMGLTREVLGGVGGAKQQSYLDKYYRDKQRSNEYDTISASGADNTVGGGAFLELGGEFQGQQEQPMQGEQMNEMQQMQPGQEGQADEMQQMQQLVQVVAGALQQGAEPQEVVQMLMQQGLPQEQAVAIVEEVMMQMQGGGQQQPQGQEMAQQGQPQMQDQQMMKYGGKKVGDLVSFKYGGKKVSGRVKKIENGKIYV